MKAFRWLPVLLFLVFVGPALAGGGGAGVRGGSGLYDSVRGVAVPWEEWELRILGEEDASLDLERLLARLPAERADLGRAIAAKWKRFGPAASWRRVKVPAAAPFDEALELDLVREFRTVQIAYAPREPGGRPVRVEYVPPLSPRGEELIRLHEAVFAVGDETYGHGSSLLTRRLIVALAADLGPERVGKAARDFVRARADLAALVARAPVLGSLARAWLALDGVPKFDAKCPPIQVAFAGGAELLVCRRTLAYGARPYADRACGPMGVDAFRRELRPSECDYRPVTAR